MSAPVTLVAVRRASGAFNLMARHSAEGPLERIGRIERYTHGRAWGLYLNGIYWITRREDGKAGRSKFVHEPSTRGGASGVTVLNLKSGIKLARITLGMPAEGSA